MKLRTKTLRWCLLLFSVITGCTSSSRSDLIRWQVRVHTTDGDSYLVQEVTDLTELDGLNRSIDQFQVSIAATQAKGYVAIRTSVKSTSEDSVFLSIDAKYNPEHYEAYNFNGLVKSAEMYRQSPHDLNAWIVETIPMQAIPAIALKKKSLFTVAISDSPFRYQNFTSQAFYTDKGLLSLRSGDDATSPGMQPEPYDTLSLDYNTEKTQVFTTGRVLANYYPVSPSQAHQFENIVLTAPGDGLSDLRRAINTAVAVHFGQIAPHDYFGALSFATPYMNLRANESLKSDLWVIPAVEYGNTQYGRDAFWISTMLPDEYAVECLRNELAEVNHFAEYPLFTIIWAYRVVKDGHKIDLDKVQSYVDAIELRAKDNAYFSYYDGDGRLDFQYWGDLMAFEKTDIITYNQGLFVIALMAAERLGLKIKSSPIGAAKIFNNTYNEEFGFYPVSEKKDILSPDAILPDLLARVYLDTLLLSSERVESHFKRMVDYSKTDFGFKVVSTPTGEYLSLEAYDIPGYTSQVSKGSWVDGEYFRGGSYFLYDNLFLMTCYVHGVTEAKELLKWRIGLDFSLGGTTYEHINTLTGIPNKPNMGWNVAIYALWNELVNKGLATDDLLIAINQTAN